jgi:ectoine hydroxylase-related dioxygenase (phytanoyl-CoA dioxygenase family)
VRGGYPVTAPVRQEDGAAPEAAADEVSAHLADIAEQGYSIIRGVLSPDEATAVLDALGELEQRLGTEPADNGFEGRSTLRVYNLLVHGEVWRRIPVHSRVLPVVEGVLDRGCLISSLSSIRIQPGETAQPIHSDDQLFPLTPPHPPVVCNTMWALTDFTDANGATRLVPASHTRGKPDFGGDYDTVAGEMTAGDVLVWHGSLWHGGGANTTEADRVGIAMNYCAGWVRQQENQQLGLPAELVSQLEPRLQELVGYSVYGGLIGHIDKQAPFQLLEQGSLPVVAAHDGARVGPTRRGDGSDRGGGLVWDAT